MLNESLGRRFAIQKLGERAVTTGISIVLIHWKIKKGREPYFEQDWKTKFVVKNRDGLSGEYLSKVERRDTTYRYISCPIMCDNLGHEDKMRRIGGPLALFS